METIFGVLRAKMKVPSSRDFQTVPLLTGNAIIGQVNRNYTIPPQLLAYTLGNSWWKTQRQRKMKHGEISALRDICAKIFQEDFHIKTHFFFLIGGRGNCGLVNKDCLLKWAILSLKNVVCEAVCFEWQFLLNIFTKLHSTGDYHQQLGFLAGGEFWGAEFNL